VKICVANMGVSTQGVKLKFSVQDSGIGIAPENQSKIFQGFTQAEASTTRRFGGTGLGLAISQQLVNMMGGRIELNSQVGEGSCFYFSIVLPEDTSGVVTATPVVDPQVNNTPHVKPLAGMRILLAEDNLINQQVAIGLLGSEGALVDIAHNGQEAIELLQARGVDGFDVVLMDIQMPVMDGYTAARKIRGELGWQDLPIVAMTANAMASDREACLAAGMNAHVGKPFELDELVVLLLNCTGKNPVTGLIQKS
jgi:CheY-like chemotaxis protein